MNRRAFAAAGILGTPKAVPRPDMLATGGVLSARGREIEYAVGRDLRPADPSRALARAAWRLAAQAHHQRAHRLLAIADALGGLPPHLASMQASAPWFKAQRAQAWRDEVSRPPPALLALEQAAGYADPDPAAP